GRATARFGDLPLLGALNQLVNPHGIAVASQSGVLVFGHGGVIDTDEGPSMMADGGDTGPSGGGADDPILYQEIGLQNLSAADAVSLLGDIYGDDDDDDDEEDASLRFGSIAELNTV